MSSCAAETVSGSSGGDAVAGLFGGAIAAVVVDSAEYAAETLQDVDYEVVLLVVAHDFRGALDGVQTGAEVGALFGSPQIGAVTGVVAGGASASIIGFYDAKDRMVECCAATATEG